jgi:hypothetical protein
MLHTGRSAMPGPSSIPDMVEHPRYVRSRRSVFRRWSQFLEAGRGIFVARCWRRSVVTGLGTATGRAFQFRAAWHDHSTTILCAGATLIVSFILTKRKTDSCYDIVPKPRFATSVGQKDAIHTLTRSAREITSAVKGAAVCFTRNGEKAVSDSAIINSRFRNCEIGFYKRRRALARLIIFDVDHETGFMAVRLKHAARTARRWTRF